MFAGGESKELGLKSKGRFWVQINHVVRNSPTSTFQYQNRVLVATVTAFPEAEQVIISVVFSDYITEAAWKYMYFSIYFSY